MNLSLDNLEEIYQLLMKVKNDADIVMQQFDFNQTVEPHSEKRPLLNILLDRTSAHLLEISHIDSFLQHCDSLDIQTLNPEQHTLLIQCQTLCQSLRASSDTVLKWVVKLKKEFNESSCPIPSVPSDIGKTETQQNSLQSDDKAWGQYSTGIDQDTLEKHLVPAYHKARDILKAIHSDLIFLDPENMTHTAGRRLGVMEGKKLFIETEHEMNVFMDYGIFQYRKEGKNIVQRYFDLRHSLYSPEDLKILTAFKNARFSFLRIILSIGDHGLVVNDPLIGKNLLMIDHGLCQVAKSNQSYAILTHYICLPEFVMTTGASTPVLFTSDAGKKMQTVFNPLILHHQGQKSLDDPAYKQCITDLYKIAIHSDVTKTVTSRALPLNYHQINKENIFIH